MAFAASVCTSERKARPNTVAHCHASMAAPPNASRTGGTSSTTSMSAVLAATAQASCGLRPPSRSQTGSVAERWFRERRIRFQSIDLGKYGISPGELKSVLNAVGLEALVDPKHPDAALLAYLAYDADKVEKLLDNPRLLKTPIVRNGRQATVGYCPEVWQGWA